MAQNQYTDTSEYIRIFNCITDKLDKVQDWIFFYNEDSRLARTIQAIFTQNTHIVDQIKGWLNYLTKNWAGSWQNGQKARAYANGRNLLRSLNWYLLMSKEVPLHNKETIMNLIQVTLEQARPWEREES